MFIQCFYGQFIIFINNNEILPSTEEQMVKPLHDFGKFILYYSTEAEQ